MLKTIKLKIVGSISETIQKEFYENLSQNVEYLGLKKGDELHSIRKNARAIVAPSIWFENQPMSILEAFACGKPVITSDLGGMTELVEDGVRGYLVEPGNVGQLADVINRTVEDKNKTLEMGKNAFQYAKENHNAEKHYERLMEIYSSLAR